VLCLRAPGFVSGEPENGEPRKGVTQHMRFALQTCWPSDNFEFRVDDAHEIEFFHLKALAPSGSLMPMPCGMIVLPGDKPLAFTSFSTMVWLPCIHTVIFLPTHELNLFRPHFDQ
jgi:hypothetical protein